MSAVHAQARASSGRSQHRSWRPLPHAPSSTARCQARCAVCRYTVDSTRFYLGTQPEPMHVRQLGNPLPLRQTGLQGPATMLRAIRDDGGGGGPGHRGRGRANSPTSPRAASPTRWARPSTTPATPSRPRRRKSTRTTGPRFRPGAPATAPPTSPPPPPSSPPTSPSAPAPSAAAVCASPLPLLPTSTAAPAICGRPGIPSSPAS